MRTAREKIVLSQDAPGKNTRGRGVVMGMLSFAMGHARLMLVVVLFAVAPATIGPGGVDGNGHPSPASTTRSLPAFLAS